MSAAPALAAAHRQMQAVAKAHADCTPDESDGLSWTIGIQRDDCPSLLEKSLRKARHERIVLHMRFPPSFPFAPPFLRVVSPVFEAMTGHVVSGGAICTEVLTLNDGPHGWRPTVCISSLITSILHMMSEGGASIVKGRGSYPEDAAHRGYRRVAARYGWKIE